MIYLRVDVNTKVGGLDVGGVGADAPALVLGHVDLVQPEDDVRRGGVGAREGDFGRGGDLRLGPGVVVLGAPFPDLDVWIVLSDFEPGGAGTPDCRIRPAVQMNTEVGGEDFISKCVQPDITVLRKVHGVNADGQVRRLCEWNDEVDLHRVLALGLFPRSDFGSVEGVLVDDTLGIHFSDEGFVAFGQNSVPADTEAVYGQFGWDGVFHNGSGIEGCELHFGSLPLEEDLCVDFRFIPSIVDPVVGVNCVPVPRNGSCGALMLVNAAKCVTKFVDYRPREFIVWCVIIEPAKVHCRFVGGNAEIRRPKIGP